MKQGSTICECGRDDVHSSKDCWTIENTIKNLADKWADDMIKDGLVNEDGTIPMSEWANLSKHPFTINSGDL